MTKNFPLFDNLVELCNVVYCAITSLDRYPLHSDNIHYIQMATLICSTALYKPCYSSLLSPTLLTSTFCFWLTFAYAQAKPPEPHHQLICNRHIHHVCASRSQAQPCGSITLETSCGMWWKPRQWRF